MIDFFSNLARLVLGLGVDVQPRLSPRFASWPSLAPVSPLAQPPAPVGESASPDIDVLPSPLIDPTDPAIIDAPLPTFRQMSELRPAARPPVQPSQPATQDRPETVDFEQTDLGQVVARPISPAVEHVSPGAPPAAPASSPTLPAAADEPSPTPVIQAGADSDTDGAVTASPAPMDASGDRPPKEGATPEHDQAVPPPPNPARRPAVGQERPPSSARFPDPPVRMGQLFRSSQAELVEAQPEPVVEVRPQPVKEQAEPIKAHAESVQARPEFVEGQSQLVRGQPEPVEARSVDMPVQPLAHVPTPAPLTVEPAVPVLAPVVQRQATPGGQPVAPLPAQPVPTAAPDLTVSTQTRPAASPTAPDLANRSLEPILPAGRAVPGWGEPGIVPAPEPAPEEMWSTLRAAAGGSRQPLSARPKIDQTEPVPTVRITIGRVVVRASPAAERPPSRRVELPQPPLSLEEYLQSRQGGAR